MKEKKSFLSREKYKWIIIGLCILILLIGLSIVLNKYDKKEFTFEEGFKELQDIDINFNASFHDEKLNKTTVKKENIKPMLDELKKFEDTLDKRSKSPHIEALLLFIDIRKMMLTSQWYYHLGREFDDRGIVIDEQGFSCREAEDVLEAAFFFNETITYASFAQSELDDLLYSYQEIPKLHQVVGTDENKTRFFYSPLDYYSLVVRTNLAAVKKHCPIEIKPFVPTMTQRFQYERKDPRIIRDELKRQGFEVEGIFK